MWHPPERIKHVPLPARWPDEAEASHDDTEDTAASPILGGPVIFFLIAVLAAVAAVIVWLIVRTRRHRGSNSDAGGDAV